MKGDFSRNTFDRAKHYSRVLMQQGRVQLDADWNEQASILTHYLRALARDLIGRHGMVYEVRKGDDFLVKAGGGSFSVYPGSYYVDGILCENDSRHDETGGPTVLPYQLQPDYPCPAELAKETVYLVYLDVWERHITYVEDPPIRERALGGPDTATRAKVVWQARVLPEAEALKGGAPPANTAAEPAGQAWAKFWKAWTPNRGLLSAWAKKPETDKVDPCLLSPDARFRGDENRLYRVEIHRSGSALAANKKGSATFKWSRDNGSVVFPVLELKGDQASLVHLGRDSQLGLKIDDWVELVDDAAELCDHQGALFQVAKVDLEGWVVTLKPPQDSPSLPIPSYDKQKAWEQHVLLRRWDGPPQAIVEDKDLELELGLCVKFVKGIKAEYRSGDYWLIPARIIAGDVEWLPLDADGNPSTLPLPPHGVAHHQAELAWISVSDKGVVKLGKDLRRGVRRTLFAS